MRETNIARCMSYLALGLLLACAPATVAAGQELPFSDMEDSPQQAQEGERTSAAEVDGEPKEPCKITMHEEERTSEDPGLVLEAQTEKASEVRALVEKLVGQCRQLEEFVQDFHDARNSFAGARDACAALSCERLRMCSLLQELDASKERSTRLIEIIDEELVHLESLGIIDVISGEASLQDLESNPYLLCRLLESERSSLEATCLDSRHVRNDIMRADMMGAGCQLVLRERLKQVNALAYGMERKCAKARQSHADASDALEHLEDGSLASIAEREELSRMLEECLSLVKQVEEDIAAHYDELDACAGLERGISYGEGLDFAMERDDFVEKWGRAIDAFYSQMGNAPLEGFGASMAASAYEHKIDPRLCAAVSVVESGGGRQCIRAHNAWGWGAADDDPAGLASEWTSFEEGIEAWHQGMATSKTGLASAPCVSALGSIYCSSPAWGADVVECMERISEYAR